MKNPLNKQTKAKLEKIYNQAEELYPGYSSEELTKWWTWTSKQREALDISEGDWIRFIRTKKGIADICVD